MDLAEFVKARLDEDEAAMRRVEGRRFYACDDGHVAEPDEQWADGSDRLPNHHNTWVAILDPARVLREVEAKREIMAEHHPTDWAAYGSVMCFRCQWDDDERGDDEAYRWVHYPCRTLRALAAVWSDHPDYDPAWSPLPVQH